jgi:hypothetical protein
MSTATTSVEVGQIRQNPADDGFVIVKRMRFSLANRLGWTVQPIDRFGRPTGEPDRWISDLTLNAWALMPADTITEPQ